MFLFDTTILYKKNAIASRSRRFARAATNKGHNQKEHTFKERQAKGPLQAV